VLEKITKPVTKFASENSAALLTATGVVGTVSTAVLSFRAGLKCAEILQEDKEERLEGVYVAPTTMEKAKLVGPQFVPPVGMVATTITAIVFAHRISATKSAAMVAAYGISEKGFREYREKIEEKLGVKKAEAIDDELAQNKIDSNPPQTIIIAGKGDVLCFDEFSGRYFRSSIENIKAGENAVNYEILNHMGAALNHFYEEIELPEIPMGADLGFNTNNRLDIKYTTALHDGEPCIVISFKWAPIPGWRNEYA